MGERIDIMNDIARAWEEEEAHERWAQENNYVRATVKKPETSEATEYWMKKYFDLLKEYNHLKYERDRRKCIKEMEEKMILRY